MLIESWRRLPLFAPDDVGAGTEADAGTVTPPPGGADTGGADTDTEAGAEGQDQGQQDQGDQRGQRDRQQEGRGSGRTKVRQQLESAASEARKNQEQRERDQRGRFQAGQGQEQAGAQQQEGAGQQQGQAQQTTQTAAPEAWAKEAKATWAQLPPAVQAAVLKRETDMAAGVENLKKGYKEIEDAIKPYSEAIAQHKTTPGAAVKQLFDWMGALTTEAMALKSGRAPTGAFAALAQSYGIDPVKLLAHMVQNPVQQQSGQQQGQGQGQQQGGQAQIDPGVKAYIDQIFGTVNQGITGLASTVQQQSMAKTNEMLAIWSKDKPYFNDVRVTMARLMTPGANGEPPVVPAREDGNADLDRAYALACQITDGVGDKIKAAAAEAEAKAKAEKEAAEKAAQRQKLEAARKASGSIPINAPGLPGDGKQQQQKRGKSVRESIDAALSEVRGRV